MSQSPPLFTIGADITDDMIDYNGHMGVAQYALLFDRCAEAFYEAVGLGRTSAENGRGSLFTLEQHTTFRREVFAGQALLIRLQLLDFDEKRLHYFLTMTDSASDIVVATNEQLAIHVNMGTRSSDPLPAEARQRIEEMLPAHDAFGPPKEAGQVIRIERKRPHTPG